jgi:YjbE family integral membrane protein
MDPLSAPFWAAVVQIIVIDLLLSGDNAVVIALACRSLPEPQRRIAIFWGVFGAIAARVTLTAFAATLLLLPYLKLFGAVLLLWIGVKLIAGDEHAPPEPGAAAAGARPRRLSPMFAAIYTVITADMIMALDNVIGVAGAARGSIPLLVFGLIVSIPLVVMGSSIVLRMITHLPVLILAGGGLLGYIAGEMVASDPAYGTPPALALVAPFAGFALVVGAGLAMSRQRRSRSAGLRPSA